MPQKELGWRNEMSKRKSINCHKCPNKGTDKCIACKKVDEDTKHK